MKRFAAAALLALSLGSLGYLAVALVGDNPPAELIPVSTSHTYPDTPDALEAFSSYLAAALPVDSVPCVHIKVGPLPFGVAGMTWYDPEPLHPHILVVLAPDDVENLFPVLIHEYAHVLTYWAGAAGVEPDHGVHFGIEWARVYTIFVEWLGSF